MSQLVKLEKRFEDAIKRLEFALSDKIVSNLLLVRLVIFINNFLKKLFRLYEFKIN